MRLFALAVGASVLFAHPSLAKQEPKQACAPTEAVAERLAQKYGEVPLWVGLDASGKMVAMIYQSPKGTWTELFVRPDGMSCLLGSGIRARFIKPKGDPS